MQRKQNSFESLCEEWFPKEAEGAQHQCKPSGYFIIYNLYSEIYCFPFICFTIQKKKAGLCAKKLVDGSQCSEWMFKVQLNHFLGYQRNTAVLPWHFLSHVLPFHSYSRYHILPSPCFSAQTRGTEILQQHIVSVIWALSWGLGLSFIENHSSSIVSSWRFVSLNWIFIRMFQYVMKT